jgi:peptide/nickel transport system substrate-binding protein
MVNLPDQATKAQSVLTGDVDMATEIATSAYSEFQNSSTVALLDLQDYDPYTFDIDSSIKPYSNPNVSKAMKMLIDRNKMLGIVVHGHGIVSADSLIPPTDPFYPSDLKPFPYDPEQAKSLLAQAGYSSGFKDDIWTTKAYPYLDEGAAFGQQAWAAGKITMTIQSVSNDQYLSAFLVKPVLMDYYLRLHPVTMFEQYYASGPNNTTRLKDDQIDGWIKELKGTLDVNKQKQIAGEILHRYNDIAAEIVPFHFNSPWPYKKRVKNIALDPMTNIDFRGVSLG